MAELRGHFPNFTEVGKLLLKAKLRFVRTKVQLAKQILQSRLNLPHMALHSKLQR
jgi:hypothetical protein